MSNSNSAPIAFMSYVHFDDKHDEGFLTELRKYLSAEVRVQTGAEFHIFQDREDIKWGQFWQERIEDSLSGVTFLILILTPSFFKSEFCRSEVEKFLNRQQNLKHESIILPIYYVNCDVLEKDSLRSNDLLAKQISRYQYVDWRDLRFEPLTSPIVRRRLADLASHIRKALDNISSKVETSNVTVQLEQPPQESNVVSTASALVQQIASHTLPKVEPPTLIVDAKGQGHYVSITSAVKVAQSGYRILVRPGIYREAFLVDKSLEIMGDGQLEEIVVESSKQAPISFNARMGQITNLTIRQTGSAFGVDITQGHLEIYDCDISSRHGMCVVVRGGAANPHIYRNLIHNSRGGVAVFDNGQGIIEDNDIFGHRMACIFIFNGGDPILRRNLIHDSQESGVYVYNKGRGLLEDNDIFRHAHAGLATSTGGDPIARNNRIKQNGIYAAVYVFDGGRGTFEGNDLRGNIKGSWQIDPKCETHIRRIGNLT